MKDFKSATVTFKDVSKVFGKNTVAVDSLSFKVEAGKLVTLLGPSGCGKTTVLRMIAGLEMATSGKILLNDEDITQLPATDRDISMVFQSYALFPHLNVFKNVAYGLNFSGLSNKEVSERVMDGLELVDLAHLAERLPNQLSGGQQQRVAVARAIVLKPEVLLFDEPLSNLDIKLRRSVREEIRDLQQKLGLTVVYVTHDQEEALAVSDLILVMKNARLAQHGTPQEIFEKPCSCFVADFIGDSNLIDCKVINVDSEKAYIKVGHHDLVIPVGAYRSGQAKIAIRPSNIKIGYDNKSNVIPSKILKASYLGVQMEYHVSTDFGNLFITSQDMDEVFQAGKDVFIYLNQDKIVLVEDEQE